MSEEMLQASKTDRDRFMLDGIKSALNSARELRVDTRGMIVAGYPGIGKSSVATVLRGTIDLESSMFSHDNPDWPIQYVTVAVSLANQGYTVFVSTHERVVSMLASMKLPNNVLGFVVFTPSLGMHGEWLERLRDRYANTKLDKDKRAYERALLHYEEDISSIEKRCIEAGIRCYHPYSVGYRLEYFIPEIRDHLVHERGREDE